MLESPTFLILLEFVAPAVDPRLIHCQYVSWRLLLRFCTFWSNWQWVFTPALPTSWVVRNQSPPRYWTQVRSQQQCDYVTQRPWENQFGIFIGCTGKRRKGQGLPPSTPTGLEGSSPTPNSRNNGKPRSARSTRNSFWQRRCLTKTNGWRWLSRRGYFVCNYETWDSKLTLWVITYKVCWPS